MTTTFKLNKMVEPANGPADNLLDLLERSLTRLQEDGRWIQGSMVAPTDHFAAREEIAKNVEENGLCGAGWGACAMGIVSVEDGTSGIIETTYDDWDYSLGMKRGTKTEKRFDSLVSEDGHVARFAGVSVPEERMKLQQEAYRALNAASAEITGNAHMTVVSVNDMDRTFARKYGFSSPYELVLAVFEKAIATEKDRLLTERVNEAVRAEVPRVLAELVSTLQ